MGHQPPRPEPPSTMGLHLRAEPRFQHRHCWNRCWQGGRLSCLAPFSGRRCLAVAEISPTSGTTCFQLSFFFQRGPEKVPGVTLMGPLWVTCCAQTRIATARGKPHCLRSAGWATETRRLEGCHLLLGEAVTVHHSCPGCSHLAHPTFHFQPFTSTFTMWLWNCTQPFPRSHDLESSPDCSPSSKSRISGKCAGLWVRSRRDSHGQRAEH